MEIANGRGRNPGDCSYGGPIRPIYSRDNNSYALQCSERQDNRGADQSSHDDDSFAPQAHKRTGWRKLVSMIWQPNQDPNLEMVKNAVRNISEKL